MSRFPALKTISMVLKLFSVLAVVSGAAAAFTENELLVRLGAIAGGLLSALMLWALSELISVALAIEANTFLAQQALTRSNTVAWTPASSRPPIPSPGTGATTSV